MNLDKIRKSVNDFVTNDLKPGVNEVKREMRDAFSDAKVYVHSSSAKFEKHMKKKSENPNFFRRVWLGFVDIAKEVADINPTYQVNIDDSNSSRIEAYKKLIQLYNERNVSEEDKKFYGILIAEMNRLFAFEDNLVANTNLLPKTKKSLLKEKL
jgi:hypothetical protein